MPTRGGGEAGVIHGGKRGTRHDIHVAVAAAPGGGVHHQRRRAGEVAVEGALLPLVARGLALLRVAELAVVSTHVDVGVDQLILHA